MELRILSAADVKQALPMAEVIEAMKSAYAQLSAGTAVMPPRAHMDIAAHTGTTLVMPAYLPQSDDLAVKVVSVFPENSRRGEPVIYGLVMALDAASGRPLAIMDGGAVTAVRTGAGSGAATDLLAQPDAGVVAILGSGVQARTQLEAVCTVRAVKEVRVYSPSSTHAATFASDMGGIGPIPDKIIIATDANAAIRDADIICAATNSATPVFDGRFLKPGVHINGVGSFQPTMQEIDSVTVQQALIVIDSREAALSEAGDLIIPLRNGIISEVDIQAELGEIVSGQHPGRTDPAQITFFKSVGTAVQDAAAVRVALAQAERQGLGQKATL